MKTLLITIIGVVAALATATAQPIDLSKYSSKPWLYRHPTKSAPTVTVAAIDPATTSSKPWLYRQSEISIAVLAESKARIQRDTVNKPSSISAASFNSKRALIGR